MKASTSFNLSIWGFVVLILTILILGPFAVIWALNTLFHTGIAYGFWEWLAVVFLNGFIQTRIGKNSR
jgi:hypothetical protein